MNEIVRSPGPQAAPAPLRVGDARPVPPPPRPAEPARRIRDDAEAIAVARDLAAEFRRGAPERDRDWLLPVQEVQAFSQSGLWAINVPRAYGGPGLSYVTVARVIAIVSAADPSLGQLPQNHLCVNDAIAADGSEAQKRRFFAEVLDGVRWGNAFSEAGSRTVAEFETALTPDGDGFRVSGRKFYATGSLLAHYVPTAAVDEAKRGHLALIPRDAPGLTLVNDWQAMGQRTTGSGSVILDDVWVPAENVVPAYKAFERPTASGPISQLIQAAIDAGIARGAFDEALEFVRSKARPWLDSGAERAQDDPFLISDVGRVATRLDAADAMLARAGRHVDAALLDPTEFTVATASVAVAEAKVLSTEAALLAANKLHEWGGTRSVATGLGLDRHWRNARTHTLHDPVRWKPFHVGNWHLNGVHPPRHPWL